MERTIRVTGKGKISVKPDTTRLYLRMDGLEKDYETALRQSTEMTESLKSKLETLGFERGELKTLSFDLDMEYESYKLKDESWKRRFKGYSYTHRMKLEFPVDNGRLGKVLYALTHCKAKPEIRMDYTVADQEAVKNVLIGKAVADCRAKAEALTAAAGVALGNVISIDYSWKEVELRIPVNYEMAEAVDEECSGESYEVDLEPDNIDVTDNVTAVWEIA